MALTRKHVLPMIGAALAIAAGHLVARWSTPEGPPPTPLVAGFEAFSSGRYSRAELLFEQARQAEPQNGDVYDGLALVALMRDGDLPRAEKLFRKSISLPGTSPVAYANFGRFLINEKRYDEAIRVLEAGVKRDPDYQPVKARLAIALFAAKRSAEACRVARSVKDPPDAEEPLIERIRNAPDCATR